ncbi:DarT ssDNA thymidine ADP-ribosyltransferase family protein [Hydrogenophaga pseudoflava]|uniref:DarT ssDNA thymidine ADP-ribosyltransferase family protein n=1 Tax=Hydrogenophaga pseudoflava TaxID=47421 RepID=UPI000A055025|nr:DarT ssDNA thymidine ADP-ribosyltransferase family protein [Hydrogenophaga pseudoflava]
MSISSFIAQRGIRELLHFTTNRGALGILASKALKSRERLGADPQLEKIFFPNAENRSRDAQWLDYVNLSVSQINERFFSISARNWHRDKDFWWAIISIHPDVMTHDGVYFTTTNNMYSGVRRQSGLIGLESMFAPRVTQWAGNVVTRSTNAPLNAPTCNQAEVLYPAQLSTQYVRCIYTHSGRDADELAGQMAAVGHEPIAIEVRPELFGEIT